MPNAINAKPSVLLMGQPSPAGNKTYCPRSGAAKLSPGHTFATKRGQDLCQGQATLLLRTGKVLSPFSSQSPDDAIKVWAFARRSMLRMQGHAQKQGRQKREDERLQKRHEQLE